MRGPAGQFWRPVSRAALDRIRAVAKTPSGTYRYNFKPLNSFFYDLMRRCVVILTWRVVKLPVIRDFVVYTRLLATISQNDCIMSLFTKNARRFLNYQHSLTGVNQPMMDERVVDFLAIFHSGWTYPTFSQWVITEFYVN